MASAQAPIFEALIVPYRSLTRKGVRMVVGSLTVLSVAVALRFWLLGAWPIAAFSLIEVPMVGILLAVNQHRARASELIMLSPQELTVIRTDPAGRRRQVSLPAAWLRVDLETNRSVPRVILSSHGQGCEIGAFLHEPEKRSLFEALRDALYRSRNPRFDNPQLRDP